METISNSILSRKYYKNRQEARGKAILKANEIFNGKQRRNEKN